MKKLLIIAFLLAMPAMLFSQDITGTWNGTFKAGEVEMRIVFHFESDGTSYNGTMDSPDQGVAGIPITTVEFDAPQIQAEIPAIGFVYTGKLEGERTIKGSFTQSGMTFELDFVKQEPAE